MAQIVHFEFKKITPFQFEDGQLIFTPGLHVLIAGIKHPKNLNSRNPGPSKYPMLYRFSTTKLHSLQVHHQSLLIGLGVSPRLKTISQIGPFQQVGVNKNI